MNIHFIGFGNMAKAISQGLLKHTSHQLSASSPSLSMGINSEGIHTFHDNIDGISKADVIILAVKPVQMSIVLNEISHYLPAKGLLISIAAGLNLEWFANRCPPNYAVIRAMPNTPASVGLAATAMTANPYTTEDQKICADTIFKNIGITAWAPKEEEMDTFTALSGSGPAYLFLFTESLIEAAVSLGLDPLIARDFALQTVAGSIKLAQNSKSSLNQLRTQVTSAGGTTAAALAVLDKKLNNLLLDAMKAAKVRAEELGAENE